MVTKDLLNIGNARVTGKMFASKFIGTFNGTADAAAALTTSAGTATKPVYFSNGKPVETTYPLQLMTAASASAAGASGLVPSAGAGANKKFLRGDASWASIAGNAYATCTTAAATAAKVATISGDVNWELVTGAMVTVYFSFTNTAQNPTLNVNGTGAKSIKYGSTTIATTHLLYAAYANRAINFIYDGTAYQFIGWSADTNTTYSAATTSAAGLMSAADKSKLDGLPSSAAVIKVLTSENLDDVMTPGFYNSGGGNTCTNKPSGVDHFGLYVIHRASGVYYTQILIGSNMTQYRRHCEAGVWSDWTVDYHTDTHHTAKLIAGASATATANAAATNGSAYLNIIENGAVRSSHKIVGSGGTTVTTDANGVITIKSTDNNTTYTLNSFGITATAAELNILDGVTATTAEINFLDGVTSNIQTQLDGKAPSSHGTHVTYATAVPLVAGTAAVGTAANVARGDHVHPAQTTISGNAGTATTLQTARTIDGVSFNGSASITHFGTCSTAAATAAKTVALTGFSLVTGSMVFVKFTVTNTASSPTLNVNSTGAKAIMYRGSAITASQLAANRVYAFIYDGTNWEFVGDRDTDSHYTATLISGASATATANAAASNGSVYLNLIEGGAVRNSHLIKGTGGTTVTSDANGVITINSTSSTSGSYVPLSGGTVTGNVQQSGATTDYTTYKFRNIAVGTSTTPTTNSTYGVSGSIYICI